MLNDFMWTAHNTCSLALNHMNIANHSSDELFALRRLSITPLPEGLVNDGAFLAGHARNLGYKVKFSEEAFVGVETPSRGIDVIGQRRRILFGHAEVWRKTGRIPRTIESLMIFSPWIGFKLLFRTLVESPQYLLILPVAAVSELVAVALSVWDVTSSSRRHSVWRRYT